MGSVKNPIENLHKPLLLRFPPLISFLKVGRDADFSYYFQTFEYFLPFIPFFLTMLGHWSRSDTFTLGPKDRSLGICV